MVLEVFWDVFDEDVGGKCCFIISAALAEQVPVELQCSTRLPVNFKIAHFLASDFKLNRVFDVDNSRVKRFGDVFPDLGSCFKNDARLLFENHGYLCAANLVLWQVIKVNQIWFF